MFFHPADILLIPAILLTIWAQWRVKSAYRKYSQIGVGSGVTGSDVARRMMQVENIHDVDLEQVPGEMTDHYDPKAKVVRLSPDVYHGHSIAALGISAHEIGHVIQDARGYAPMRLRSAVYPVSAIGSTLGMPMVIIGYFMGAAGQSIALAGILLFSAAVAFTIVTLPVEFNASSRAMASLRQSGLMTADELAGAKRVLNAAAMTYVASAAVAVLNLVRLLIITRGNDE